MLLRRLKKTTWGLTVGSFNIWKFERRFFLLVIQNNMSLHCSSFNIRKIWTEIFIGDLKPSVVQEPRSCLKLHCQSRVVWGGPVKPICWRTNVLCLSMTIPVKHLGSAKSLWLCYRHSSTIFRLQNLALAAPINASSTPWDQSLLINIAKGTTDPRRWVFWLIQHL